LSNFPISELCQVEERLILLNHTGKYKESIKFLDNASNNFHINSFEISKELAIPYAKTGQYAKSLDTWERGHKKGYFYGIFSCFPIF
jgi:hypothetical protein